MGTGGCPYLNTRPTPLRIKAIPGSLPKPGSLSTMAAKAVPPAGRRCRSGRRPSGVGRVRCVALVAEGDHEVAYLQAAQPGESGGAEVAGRDWCHAGPKRGARQVVPGGLDKVASRNGDPPGPDQGVSNRRPSWLPTAANSAGPSACSRISLTAWSIQSVISRRSHIAASAACLALAKLSADLAQVTQ